MEFSWENAAFFFRENSWEFSRREPNSRSFLLPVSHERSDFYDLCLFSRGGQTPGH